MAKKSKDGNKVPKIEERKTTQQAKVKKTMLKQKKKMKQVLKDRAPSSNAFSEMKQASVITTKPKVNSHKSQFQGKNSKFKGHTSQAPLSTTPSKTVEKHSAHEKAIHLNGSSDIVSNRPAGRKPKRKKGSKKGHDGVSNWASLCSKLKIDPNRKNKHRQTEEKKNEDEKLPEPTRSKPDIWFDNVDKFLIEGEHSKELNSTAEEREKTADDKLVKPDSYKGVTQCVAMDCEMVGVGRTGEESILARVSIVNHFGVCLYDKFVLPRERVTDYRTHVSGVTRENLSTGEEFTKVQKEVSDIIKGKILIGHALHNDLKVLFLTHPHKMIRDTSKYKPFRQLFKGGNPSLKKLADKVLGVSVQEGQHSSVQDAQATVRLYTLYRQQWEKELRKVWKQDKKKLKKKTKKKQTKP